MIRFLFSTLALLSSFAPLRADDGSKASALADAVLAASGGQNWSRVKTIGFTFHVAQGDKVLLTATHHWDVRAGTDTVAWAGKTFTIDLAGTNLGGEAKAAYQRWVNDAYWLLMPLKLKDEGVHLVYQGLCGYSTNFPFVVRDRVGGEKYEVLRLLFDRVGLTPTDEYSLFIDPKTHLVRYWVYMPSPAKPVGGTWDGYQDFGGLKLSTEHQFGDKHIWFTEVQVEISTGAGR